MENTRALTKFNRENFGPGAHGLKPKSFRLKWKKKIDSVYFKWTSPAIVELNLWLTHS